MGFFYWLMIECWIFHWNFSVRGKSRLAASSSAI